MNDFTDKPAFTPQRLEEERDKDKGRVFTIRLNEEEAKQLEEVMAFLQQPKDSTAYKQMFRLGYINVIHDEKIKAILTAVLENRRKNWRTGIEPEKAASWQM
jgi:hypothetical protein